MSLILMGNLPHQRQGAQNGKNAKLPGRNAGPEHISEQGAFQRSSRYAETLG